MQLELKLEMGKLAAEFIGQLAMDGVEFTARQNGEILMVTIYRI